MNQSIKESIIENQQHVYTDIHDAMIETKRTVTGRLVRQEINNINMADTSTLKEQIKKSQNILTKWDAFLTNDITEMTMPEIIDFWKANYPSNTKTNLIIPQVNAINYHMYSLLQKHFEQFNKENKDEIILTLDYISAKPAITVELALKELQDIVTFQSSSAKSLMYKMTNNFQPGAELEVIDRPSIEKDFVNSIDHNINGKVYYSFINNVLSKMMGYDDSDMMFYSLISFYKGGYIFNKNTDIERINIPQNDNTDDSSNIIQPRDFENSRYVAHYLSSHTIMDTLNRIIDNLIDQTDYIKSLQKQQKSIIHKNKIKAIQKKWADSNQIDDLDDRYDRIKEIYNYTLALQNYLETERHIPELYAFITEMYSNQIDRIEQNIAKVEIYLTELHLT